MRSAKEDVPLRQKQAINLVSAVKELHTLSSQELGKLIRDADNDTIQWTTSNGSSNQVDVETLANFLALHLIAKLLSSKRDEELFKYLLGGLRLLHGLCDLAPRNSKLEMVLLDDVKVSEQMFDLVFYMIVVLGDSKQKVSTSSDLVLLHSVLLACSLYLLTAFVSSQWHELALVLLAHPKVDIFMDVAFAALHIDIQFLQARLLAQYTDTGMQSNLAEVNRLCQHCEASLQFLQSLCQQRFFRERLVKNKELCGEGGILLLAHDIMKLPFCEESYLMAVVSRLKSKVLSILLHLCEVESVSFLDVAASTTGGLNLAKSTIFQVLELLKTMFRGDLNGLAAFADKTYPRGLLQLNAMRLTEILSDDSNFRSYITLNFTEVLTTIFLLPHAEFLSSWCSSESPPSEEDATLDYDSLAAAGWVLGVLPSSDVPESTFNACRVPRTSYAYQRTSLLVKIVANLTCFIPDLCKEEKDLFLNTFLQCLQKLLPTLPYGVQNDVEAEKAAIVIQNLRSLLIHAGSLVPGFLNEDDVQLLRLFIGQLELLINRESKVINLELNPPPLDLSRTEVILSGSNAEPRAQSIFSSFAPPTLSLDPPLVFPPFSATNIILQDISAGTLQGMMHQNIGPAGTSMRQGILEGGVEHFSGYQSFEDFTKPPAGPNLGDIHNSLKDLVTKVESYNTTLSTNSSAVTDIGENLKTLTTEVAKKASSADMERVDGSISQFATTLANNSTIVNDLNLTNTTLATNFTTLSNEVTSLKTEMVTLKGEVTSLKTEMVTPKGEVTSLKTEMVTLKGEVSSVKDLLQQVFDRLNAPTCAPSHFTQADREYLQSLNPAVSGLEDRIAAIETFMGITGQEDSDSHTAAAAIPMTSLTHNVEEGETNETDVAASNAQPQGVENPEGTKKPSSVSKGEQLEEKHDEVVADVTQPYADEVESEEEAEDDELIDIDDEEPSSSPKNDDDDDADDFFFVQPIVKAPA